MSPGALKRNRNYFHQTLLLQMAAPAHTSALTNDIKNEAFHSKSFQKEHERGQNLKKIIENRSILATGDDNNQNCFSHTDCYSPVLYHFMSRAAEEKSMSLLCRPKFLVTFAACTHVQNLCRLCRAKPFQSEQEEQLLHARLGRAPRPTQHLRPL